MYGKWDPVPYGTGLWEEIAEIKEKVLVSYFTQNTWIEKPFFFFGKK